MADLTCNFDARLTLADTQSACEIGQQYGRYQLQRITAKTLVVEGRVLSVNTANFVERPTGSLPNLLFVLIGTQDPHELRRRKENEGWTYISDSTIYVQGVLEPVMVFGK